MKKSVYYHTSSNAIEMCLMLNFVPVDQNPKSSYQEVSGLKEILIYDLMLAYTWMMCHVIFPLLFGQLFTFPSSCLSDGQPSFKLPLRSLTPTVTLCMKSPHSLCFSLMIINQWNVLIQKVKQSCWAQNLLNENIRRSNGMYNKFKKMDTRVSLRGRL